VSMGYSKSFPFGPFAPAEIIKIIGTLTNTSPDQTISICEGVCIGDPLTYSLGAIASIPNGYTFEFGNGDTTLGIWDVAGPLLPGEEKDFIFGEYLPLSQAPLGTYAFGVQLQIFAAIAERPMVGTSTFSGTWKVIESALVPEPTSLALLFAALGAILVVDGSKKRRAFTSPCVCADDSGKAA
jgi:hypothetical protein